MNENKIELKEIFFNEEDIEKINKRFIVLDTETTGLNKINDRIIELGAVYFENNKPMKKFNTLIKVDKEISPMARRINNISNKMLEQGLSENEAYKNFINFLGEAVNGEIIIVAHNASFDMDFLKNTLERLGYSGKIIYGDTLYLSRNILNYKVINHKLETLCEYFDIINYNKHRAYSDAMACGKILIKLLEEEKNPSNKIINQNKIALSERKINKDNTLISNKIIVVTGIISSITRAEIKELIEEYGGIFKDSVSRKTDILIVGDCPGAKYKKALELGTEIWDEEKFELMIRKLKNEGINEGKHIIQYDLFGEFLNEFVSIADAARRTGINKRKIKKVAKGYKSEAGECIWKYKQ